MANVKIILDPKWGGSLSGPEFDGLKAKDITLKLAQYTEEALNKKWSGHKVRLTRIEDTDVDMDARIMKANSWPADLVISFGVNASPPEKKGQGYGFESYIFEGRWPTKDQTKLLQEIIHEEIVNYTGWVDRGEKERRNDITQKTSMHAIETYSGFLDNPGDQTLLKNKDSLKRIALAHAIGIARAMKLPYK